MIVQIDIPIFTDFSGMEGTAADQPWRKRLCEDFIDGSVS
jgi:hypothetical protein